MNILMTNQIRNIQSLSIWCEYVQAFYDTWLYFNAKTSVYLNMFWILVKFPGIFLKRVLLRWSSSRTTLLSTSGQSVDVKQNVWILGYRRVVQWNLQHLFVRSEFEETDESLELKQYNFYLPWFCVSSFFNFISDWWSRWIYRNTVSLHMNSRT